MITDKLNDALHKKFSADFEIHHRQFRSDVEALHSKYKHNVLCDTMVLSIGHPLRDAYYYGYYAGPNANPIYDKCKEDYITKSIVSWLEQYNSLTQGINE